MEALGREEETPLAPFPVPGQKRRHLPETTSSTPNHSALRTASGYRILGVGQVDPESSPLGGGEEQSLQLALSEACTVVLASLWY